MAPVTHVLTEEEREFCRVAGIVVGFDDDDESKHQFVHLCWPYQARSGALCASSRLWFSGGTPESIDCHDCYQHLVYRLTYPKDLLLIVGRLARRAALLAEVVHATRDLLELTDHPDKYVGKDWARLPGARERLDKALLAEHQDFVASELPEKPLAMF